MAICGHHYPVENCHNCWLWVEEERRFLQRVLECLEATGALSPPQIEAAMDDAERREKQDGHLPRDFSEVDRAFAQELWDALGPYQRAGLLVNGLRLPRWLELANDGLLDLPELHDRKVFRED